MAEVIDLSLDDLPTGPNIARAAPQNNAAQEEYNVP
jgi:hypothetical protein